MSVRDRIEEVRTRMAHLEVDGFLVSAPENRRYLSGFTGSAGHLLITESAAVLVTDFRYVEQAEAEAPDLAVHRTVIGTPWLPELVATLVVHTLGVEADHLAVGTFRRFEQVLTESEEAPHIELIETSGVVEEVRAIKDADERALLEYAIEIADLAMGAVGPSIEPGMTEKQIAWEIESEMRRLDADGPAFDTIVGAGPNGALPHHRADDTPVRPGDPVVIDMGANYRGYRSDLTRTFAVGGPDDTFRRIYTTVLRAQQTAIQEVRAGMTGEEIDSIARQVIADAGHGEEFGHGLGHGVGLAVHERPMIVPKSEDLIENGMIFTIEPGIYISGWGGVRIEDIVVMEDGRAKPLTRSPK